MDNAKMKLKVGAYCRYFRVHDLGLTLQNLSDHSGYTTQTISAFEHGKSSNMLLLFSVYWNACKDDEVKRSFSNGLFNIM